MAAKKRTNESVKAECEKLGCHLKSEYVGGTTKILIQWFRGCKHEEWKLFHSLKVGTGCGKCSPRKKRTNESVKAECEKLGCHLKSAFVGVRKKVQITWFRDCKCTEWKVFNSLRTGTGCGKCSNNKKLGLTHFKHFGRSKEGEKFTVDPGQTYSGVDFPVRITWAHGHKDSKRLSDLKRGVGCWCNHGWTRAKIAEFVLSLGQDFVNMSTAERFVVLQKGRQFEGLNKSVQRMIVRGDFFPDSQAPKEKSEVEKRLETLTGGMTQFDDIGGDDEDLSKLRRSVDVLSGEESSSEDDGSGYEGLPPALLEKNLNALNDEIAAHLSDAEAIERLVQLRMARIWNAALKNTKVISNLRKANPRGFGKEVRDRVLEEYDAAVTLPIPAGFKFPHPPTLMQRRMAVSVRTKKRYGNWSSMGSGKTGSAILTSRVIKAKLTVVVVPNVLAEEENGTCQWGRETQRWFPNTEVQTKTWTPNWKGQPPRYLILNHEMFQQPNVMESIRAFFAENTVDFIVIDEVHKAKQRGDEASRRRLALLHFIAEAERKNPNLHLLTMSGTPVINTLREGVSQIELIQGVVRQDIPITANASNCLNLYCEMVNVGFRQQNNHSTQKTTEEIPIECESALPELRALGSGHGPVEREEILTRLKIPTIVKNCKKGEPTLIYTHYVGADDGGGSIVDMLVRAARKKGLTVGVYTGTDKTGKAPFMAGKLDVLVASSAIATGVDGLQNVCHKLIINVLPWTRAELDQLVARLHRTGQKKDVQVIIPVTTTIIDGEERSWCRHVLSTLKYKKTVADAAVDGVWPEGELENLESAWKSWRESLGGEAAVKKAA